VDGHLAVFDGTTGKLVKDGGVVPSGGGGLPPSTGANKVLADDGTTQGWSDTPILTSLTIPASDFDFEIIHDLFGLAHKKISTGATRRLFSTEVGGSSKLSGPGDSQAWLAYANDPTKPCAIFGIGLGASWDAAHDGAILVGRSLNDTADNQTWFGDTVHPVFLIGTPNITVIASGENDTSFRLKNKTNAELGCIYWDANNWVMGTQGGVDEGGTARDTILSSAANLILATEGTSRWTLDHDTGHLRPWADAAYDIGGGSYRARNLYLDGLTFDHEGRILTVVRVNDVTITPTVNGDPGTTSYTYAVVATFPDSGAHTSVYDNQILVSTGAATLDADHSITLAWDPTPGASGYNIYRVVSNGTPSSIGLIGTMGTDLSTPFTDTGLEGDGIVPPFTNTTGRLDLSGPLVTFNNGPLVLGLPGSPTADQTIQPAASVSGNGASLLLQAPNGAEGGDGGSISISAGSAVSGDVTTASGAGVSFNSGTSLSGGAVSFIAGAGTDTVPGGDVVFRAGGGAFGHGAVQFQDPATYAPVLTLNDTDLLSVRPITAPDFIVSGSRFKTDTVDGHAASLSAYDVDGAAYVDFITVTNGNVPTCVVKATDFKSSDGSSGVTQSIVIPGVVTITVKNGIITAAA